MIAALVLMTLDHRQHHLESIRGAILLTLTPLQYVANLPFAVGNWASDALATRYQLQQENRQLKQSQLEQAYKLQKLDSLETENRRLRALLQSAERSWERVLIAELLAVDFDPFTRQVLLNKGSVDDVFEGHPLLDAEGVMGQVTHVSPLNSVAMLITDPSHAIPVQVNRNGLRAIALGTGDPHSLEIPHIPNSTDIVVGDLLVTSGLGRRFPAGYPVAEIIEVERRPTDAYARVTARPLAKLERRREVLLVWPPNESESDGESGQ